MEQGYWLRDPFGSVDNFFFLTPEAASLVSYPDGYTLTTTPPPDPEPPSPPTDDVPQEITNFQARIALMQVPYTDGISLFDVVDSTLRADKDSPTGRFAWQAWEQANTFTRSGQIINAMAGQLGIAQSELDDLFRTASTIEA